jgi:hypothetical protein
MLHLKTPFGGDRAGRPIKRIKRKSRYEVNLEGERVACSVVQPVAAIGGELRENCCIGL